MFQWFKQFFDMGDEEFRKEMAELHAPGSAEVHSTLVKAKTPWRPKYVPPDYSFGTYVCEADRKLTNWEG